MLSAVPDNAGEPASGEPSVFASTSELVEDIRNGRIVVLIDDEDRENEGDLVFAAEFVTPEKINFLAKHGRGLICMPITAEHARQLNLPPMVGSNRSVHGTNFTVAIEAAEGVTTGISAADRAHTIRVASQPDARPSDLVQPGHVFPLVSQPGGVLVRAGHTEACCDLARLAGLHPAAVLCEIMNEDGTMARLPDLVPFVRQHGLKLGTIADLIEYRAAHESMIERVAQRRLRTFAGELEMVAYRDKPSGSVHLALVQGKPTPDQEVLVRVHEPLSVLDVLEVDRLGHSWPLGKALAMIAASACGVIVLLNCGESNERLIERLSQRVQVDALALPRRAGEHHDLRTYGVGAQILRDLGVARMKLLAKPRKMPSMAGFGLVTTGYLEG
ncbi:MAG TPA: bifunctional 3,4-dihydroxy-2-butanone-4-phosphate synthase/GTP cyclohydrolase II [Burkholderiaceae bacterium]|nr:bifunctional 3,4-dihydroxy-2-butanone-4-phosphate synthase/GTP cyclohydrolase II [Burkholderiaceae bacterium]